MTRINNQPHGIRIKLTRHAIQQASSRGAFHIGPYGEFAFSRATSFIRRVLKYGTMEEMNPGDYRIVHGLWVAPIRPPRGRSGRTWTCVTAYPRAENLPTDQHSA